VSRVRLSKNDAERGVFVAQNVRAGWWLKLDHGKEQFDQLNLEVNLWITEHQGESPWRARPEYDSNLGCLRFFVAEVEPMPPRWGLLLADALHNVRCALDHIAWHVVAIGSSPPARAADQRRVGFPIYDTADGFANSDGTRIPGVSGQQRAIIELHQPHHRGSNAGMHPLALLQDLNNTDKHRELRTLVAARGGNLRIDLTPPMGSQVDHWEFVPPFEDERLIELGMEIARAYGRFEDGEMNIRLIAETGIALDNGLDPKPTFESIHAEASDVLQELEATL
jgi:hypothetical protein